MSKMLLFAPSYLRLRPSLPPMDKKLGEALGFLRGREGRVEARAGWGAVNNDFGHEKNLFRAPHPRHSLPRLCKFSHVGQFSGTLANLRSQPVFRYFGKFEKKRFSGYFGKFENIEIAP